MSDFMETNPYAASHLPAENLSEEVDTFAWTEDKVFRDGNLLVIHCSASFPPICVRTGEPATETVDIELSCTGKDDYSINNGPFSWNKFFRSLLLQPRRYQFSVPISSHWKWQYARRKFFVRVCCAIAVLFIAMGLFILYFEHYALKLTVARPSAIGSTVLGVLLLVLAWCVDNRLHHLKSIVHIQKGFFYIYGADKRMLAQLFDSPIKISWWQRLFFP
jgi:hypothetical protein